MSERYMDQVLDGAALWTDIDDYVQRWHDERPPNELHEFLGFAPDEYALWVEQPRALRLIIAARERHQPVRELVTPVDEQAFAARGLDEKDVRVVRRWLQQTGRLSDG
jgi:hypothetical protein